MPENFAILFRGLPYLYSDVPPNPMLIIKAPIWEFPKIRITVCWGPYNKDPTI